MTLTTITQTGILKAVKPVEGKEAVRGLLVTEDNKPGIVIEVYGKLREDFETLKGKNIAVSGKCWLVDTEQAGAKQTLFVECKSFAIVDKIGISLITLVGNLGRDPEVRYTNDGLPIGDVSLAVADYVDGQKTTSWYPVTLWRKTAENVGNYLKKGNSLEVYGQLQWDEWTDKQTGENRYKLKVNAQGASFGFKQSHNGSNGDNREDGAVGNQNNIVPFKSSADLSDIPF